MRACDKWHVEKWSCWFEVYCFPLKGTFLDEDAKEWLILLASLASRNCLAKSSPKRYWLVMGTSAEQIAEFSVFISHVIKTKNRNRSITKFKNLGYHR